MTDLTQPLAFASGATMKNRFMLAPLTNCQSHADGTLSDDEYRWLTMRAEGGFGLTMTCAAHVQAIGQGFPGQLGIWDDKHIEGLTRLAEGIKKNDSIALVQLHHAGMRSTLVKDLLDGQPVCPSDNERDGARGLTNAETKQLIEDFIRGAERAQEVRNRVLRPAAALVERELLGATRFLDRAQARRDLVVRLVPGDLRSRDEHGAGKRQPFG